MLMKGDQGGTFGEEVYHYLLERGGHVRTGLRVGIRADRRIIKVFIYPKIIVGRRG